ncbi:hypothetical protein [Paenibacillus sp.]
MIMSDFIKIGNEVTGNQVTYKQITDDFKRLTGQDSVTVKYMLQHANEYQVGERHSKDN